MTEFSLILISLKVYGLRFPDTPVWAESWSIHNLQLSSILKSTINIGKLTITSVASMSFPFHPHRPDDIAKFAHPLATEGDTYKSPTITRGPAIGHHDATGERAPEPPAAGGPVP